MKARNWMTGWLLLCLLLPGALHAQEAPEPYTQAELDQMLAPVALYPDTVLSHILIAATYPLEVVQAARWSEQNPGLEGEAALDAVQGQDWDESVKALVAFPNILERMHEDLDWTQQLGEAFLVQEERVLDTIQGLRHRADTVDKLKSNEHVEVVRDRRRDREVIYIESRSPRVVYVPYYDPWVVYGPWWWPAHPPVFWSYPPGFHSSIGFHWSRGYRVSPFFFSSSFHWFNRHVVIIHHHHIHHGHYRSGRQIVHHKGAKRWQHEPRHRRNVPYRAVSPRAGVVQHSPRHLQRSERRDWAQERRSKLDRGELARPDPAHVSNRARVQAEPGIPQQRLNRTRQGTDDNRANQPNQPDTSARTPQARTSTRQSRPSFQARPQVQAPRSQSRPQVQSRPSIQSSPTVRTQAEPKIAIPKPQQAARQQQSAPRYSAPQSSAPRQQSTPQRSATRQSASPPRASRSRSNSSQRSPQRDSGHPSARRQER